MNSLLDTNILRYASRSKNTRQFFEYLNPAGANLFVSVVSVAEAKSILFQNNWSLPKVERFEAILDQLTLIEVTDYLISTNVQIDAFSQRKNPAIQEYAFVTPRNMGKNDLWISATASLLQLELITTDTDFSHLDDVFLTLRCIDPAVFKQLDSQ